MDYHISHCSAESIRFCVTNMYQVEKVIFEYTSSVKISFVQKARDSWIFFQPKDSDIRKIVKSNIVLDLPKPQELPESSRPKTK